MNKEGCDILNFVVSAEIACDKAKLVTILCLANYMLKAIDKYASVTPDKFIEVCTKRGELSVEEVESALEYFIDSDIVEYTDKGNGMQFFILWDNVAAYEQKPIPQDLPSKGVDFESWWNLYDKKVGSRTKLISKWNKLSNKSKQLIMEHTKLYVQATPVKAYRKNPQTYLNNKSWEDEIILPESQKETPHSPSPPPPPQVEQVPDEIALRYHRLRGANVQKV